MRYEFVGGSSAKFWEIVLAGKTLHVRWGRIGTTGQAQTKTFKTPELARAAHDKLVEEKLTKGYRPSGKKAAPERGARPTKAKAPKSGQRSGAVGIAKTAALVDRSRKPTSKGKDLPDDFEEALERGDLVKLEAVFDTCDVDARGGHGRQTALAFDECPDALARWLVRRGADLSATDAWGNTPLHTRAGHWRGNIACLLELGADVHSASGRFGTPLHAAAATKIAENARLLIAAGAKVDARNADGLTPLELALDGCTNAELDRMPAFVSALLDAGAARTPAMREMVEKIGRTFEFHREAFDRDSVAEASAALDFLYTTFDVPPVPRRQVHDGRARIRAKATTWQRQHAELWEQLVPSRGPAKTVQGEVIRITGRISDEWERNGGANWDRDYDEMARALVTHVGTGAALEPVEVDEIESIVGLLGESGGEGNDRLAALAVKWVLENPKPVALPRPRYRR